MNMNGWRSEKTLGVNEGRMSDNVEMRFVAWRNVQRMSESQVVFQSRMSKRDWTRIFEFLKHFSLGFREGRRRSRSTFWARRR